MSSDRVEDQRTPTKTHEEIKLGMSNFDHSIDEGLADALRAGAFYAQHAAWNFCGYVWWDGEQFCEQVWTYGAPVAVLRAPTLEDLMWVVNSDFGGN